MPHMEKKVYLHVCMHIHRSIDVYPPSLFLPLSQNLGIQVDIEKMISALEATVPPLYQQASAQPPNYEMRIVTRFCAGTFGGISHRGPYRYTARLHIHISHRGLYRYTTRLHIHRFCSGGFGGISLDTKYMYL